MSDSENNAANKVNRNVVLVLCIITMIICAFIGFLFTVSVFTDDFDEPQFIQEGDVK